MSKIYYWVYTQKKFPIVSLHFPHKIGIKNEKRLFLYYISYIATYILHLHITERRGKKNDTLQISNSRINNRQ